MNVRELMRTEVVTAAPADEFKELVDRMAVRNVSCLPVVDADGHVLGIVSETDLLVNEAFEGPKRGLALVGATLRGHDAWLLRKSGARRARDLMTRDVLSAHPDDDIRSTARRLLDWSVNHMPVVDDGRLVGIVSRQDLLRVFRVTDHAIHAETTAALADPARVPPGTAVSVDVRGGVVSLVGSVARPDDVDVVVSLARSVDGVVDVDYDIAVRGRS